MDGWEIFKIVAAAIGIIAGAIGSVGVIYKFVTDWGKRIANFIRSHGARGDIRRLEGTITELSDALHALQETATRNTSRLANMADELDANTRLTLKLELKSLFRNHPECTQVIENTMKKYRDLGGDSYIDTLYEEWKENYEKPKMREVLGKGAK